MRPFATGPAARAAWEQALEGDREAVVSQTPAWMDCLTALGRHADVSRAYETPDGRRFVLPMARSLRPPRPITVVGSMPFGWGVGGLVGDAPRSRDVADVITDVVATGALRIEARPGPAAAGAWAAGMPARARRTALMAQTLELDDGFERVWKERFSSRVRRNCRKAERLGITVRADDEGRLVPVFDALYRASVSRWAARQHEPARLAQWRGLRRDPAAKFAGVARGLGRSCRIWVADHDGTPAAAIVVLGHGDHSTYWRGAMDETVARGTGANELLHRRAIEWACAAGHRRYHMGDSDPGSSLAHFKRGFGAQERHHVAYRLERLPVTAAEVAARRAVKRAVSFRD